MVKSIKAQVSLRATFDALGIVVKGRKAICPLHQDTRPSMSFNEAGLWYCFVCGVGGDQIKLVELVERISFKEALEWFNQKFSLNITANAPYKPDPYLECLNANYQSLKKSFLKEFNDNCKRMWGLLKKKRHLWKSKDYTFELIYIDLMDSIESKLRELENARYKLRNRATSSH